VIVRIWKDRVVSQADRGVVFHADRVVAFHADRDVAFHADRSVAFHADRDVAFHADRGVARDVAVLKVRTRVHVGIWIIKVRCILN